MFPLAPPRSTFRSFLLRAPGGEAVKGGVGAGLEALQRIRYGRLIVAISNKRIRRLAKAKYSCARLGSLKRVLL